MVEEEGKEHLSILKALNEIPFPVGKNLLIDFLKGDEGNKSIIKNKLTELTNFGALEETSNEDVRQTLEMLIQNGLVDLTGGEFNKFSKVLSTTSKGNEELIRPSLQNKKLKNNFSLKSNSEITEQDRLVFKELDSLLGKFNDEQKKSIVSQKEKILCLAGAGSGKTTALTRRIEFLIKYKGVDPKKILAITFTRKAKREMEERLLNLGIQVTVETFNSFCEKILKKYESKIYTQNINVIKFQDKVLAVVMALNSAGSDMSSAIDKYFSPSQRRNKTQHKLTNIFVNDCFSLIDYFKTKNIPLSDFSKDVELENVEVAKLLYGIINFIEEHMKVQGLRDYTDQILDAKKFFSEYPENIPEYEHVLVDEYQDVNSLQIDLLNILKPKNLFVVGDPRQSIFGWRGSDINYILNFPKEHEDTEIISLNKNYRSKSEIVNFMNLSLEKLELPDLEQVREKGAKIKLKDFTTETDEFNFVVDEVLKSELKRKDIFVLARTNRQLEEISKIMKLKNIEHIIKSDETNNSLEANQNQVTLATVHSIKGLQAKLVFLVGANEKNFPCKVSDHPCLEMIKDEDYDKEEEERRLFYVAISRARDNLIITHSGKNHTYFITEEMKKLLTKPSFESILE